MSFKSVRRTRTAAVGPWARVEDPCERTTYLPFKRLITRTSRNFPRTAPDKVRNRHVGGAVDLHSHSPIAAGSVPTGAAYDWPQPRRGYGPPGETGATAAVLSLPSRSRR